MGAELSRSTQASGSGGDEVAQAGTARDGSPGREGVDKHVPAGLVQPRGVQSPHRQPRDDGFGATSILAFGGAYPLDATLVDTTKEKRAADDGERGGLPMAPPVAQALPSAIQPDSGVRQALKGVAAERVSEEVGRRATAPASGDSDVDPGRQRQEGQHEQGQREKGQRDEVQHGAEPEVSLFRSFGVNRKPSPDGHGKVRAFSHFRRTWSLARVCRDLFPVLVAYPCILFSVRLVSH